MTPTEFPAAAPVALPAPATGISVAVVVPCYNAALWLESLFESVLAQQDASWELVLVNDGSTDGTANVLDQICAREPRARVLHIAQSGPANARNVGARAASSGARFLFFLDADDRLHPRALATLSAYLDAHPLVGVVACGFDEIDERGERVRAGSRSRWVPGRFVPRALRPDEPVTPFVSFFCATGQGPFALYRRATWERTAGWDAALRYAEDADMFCQMALEAEAHYLPARLYEKRVHGAQAMSASNHDQIQAGYRQLRRKWDSFAPQTPRQAATLEAARLHYRRRHAPFRDLKVACRLLGEWVRGPRRDPREARRGVRLFVSAARGFLGRGAANRSAHGAPRDVSAASTADLARDPETVARGDAMSDTNDARGVNSAHDAATQSAAVDEARDADVAHNVNTARDADEARDADVVRDADAARDVDVARDVDAAWGVNPARDADAPDDSHATRDVTNARGAADAPGAC